MFVSDYIIYCPRFSNLRKPRNKNLTSRNKSKRSNLLPPRRNNTVPVDTVIQEINDEYGMIVLETYRAGTYVAVHSLSSHSSDHLLQAQFEFYACEL